MTTPRPGEPPQTDSAGLPWTGRTVVDTGFADDDGSADPGLRAALAAGDETAWMRLLATSRVLVPVVATDDSPDAGEQHHRRDGDSAATMATVIVAGPEGVPALPVFTGLDALVAWDPGARPSPVRAPDAARAAIGQECGLLLLDPGSPWQAVVRSSMVWALAQQQDWQPAHVDPFVAAKVADAVRDLEPVVRTELGDGSDVAPGVLRVVIVLRPGLDQAQVQTLATTIGERLATDGEVRARIDGLTFALRAAPTPSAG